MHTEDCPPSGMLMASMRAVGYSLQTAIADIVDNSLAANASIVNILFDGSAPQPYVAILDDGDGMNPAQARAAMRLAGTNATEHRSAADLGRFGLGLKTASLSQCKRLTVVTKSSGIVSALSWDLDLLEKSGRWSLLVLDPEEIAEIPHIADLESQRSGTLVVWKDLDRLLTDEPNKGRFLDAQMETVRDHLSLVFHRFINGDVGDRRRIKLNHVDVAAIDPFLSHSKGTQVGLPEEMKIGASRVSVQSFTLPYLNRMTAQERAVATTHGSLRDTQGFYVYRAGRLVVWGTWFRLTPKNELGRLTRVRVDIPNSLDHLWSLDIKKSSAVPPTAVRNRLRELASRFIEPSERVHRFRGRKANIDDPIARTWAVVEDRDSTRYEINRNHPVLQRLTQSLPPAELSTLEQVLKIVESTFPVQDLFNRMSSDVAIEQTATSESLIEALVRLWRIDSRQLAPDLFIDLMTQSEPFNVLASSRSALLARLQSLPVPESASATNA